MNCTYDINASSFVCLDSRFHIPLGLAELLRKQRPLVPGKIVSPQREVIHG